MAGEQAGSTVCVTGATGLIGSWLVMRLLDRGYFVRATVRDPGNRGKVKHLLELANARTLLSLWKADLSEEGSFDDAIEGCEGVFHVASPIDFLSVKDPENDYIKPTVNGVLNVLRSCCKAKTVKKIIFTSSISSIEVQSEPPREYNESFWTDVEFCRAQKPFAWMYYVAKTEAEKVAWKFAEENGLDLVAINPSTVMGPFITPERSPTAEGALALITRNRGLYQMLTRGYAVHSEDVCNAHIYLFENPQAKGRYICSTHSFTIFDVAESLSKKYPDYSIPTKFEGIDESLKPVPFSSKKLLDLGFEFKYSSFDGYEVGDFCAEAIETCKEKGLMPPLLSEGL